MALPPHTDGVSQFPLPSTHEMLKDSSGSPSVGVVPATVLGLWAPVCSALHGSADKQKQKTLRLRPSTANPETTSTGIF
jgi:hypothetical protein